MVQESETREAGLLSKITDLESDIKNAKKGERRAVSEVERLSAQNGGLHKEVEKQHEEIKKVKSCQLIMKMSIGKKLNMLFLGDVFVLENCLVCKMFNIYLFIF